MMWPTTMLPIATAGWVWRILLGGIGMVTYWLGMVALALWVISKLAEIKKHEK